MEKALSITKRWQLSLKFSKSRPACRRRQVVNPRHQTPKGQSVAKPGTSQQNILFENIKFQKAPRSSHHASACHHAPGCHHAPECHQASCYHHASCCHNSPRCHHAPGRHHPKGCHHAPICHRATTNQRLPSRPKLPPGHHYASWLLTRQTFPLIFPMYCLH